MKQDETESEEISHYEELKEIYLKTESDVATVVDFVNDIIKKMEPDFNLYLSISFEKEITKYGKIIHVTLLFELIIYRNQKEE